MKEIHAKMLRKHLQRLEQPSEGEDRPESDNGLRPVEEASDHDEKGLCLIKASREYGGFIFRFLNLGLFSNFLIPSVDAETYSPEPIIQEEIHEVEEEAGSFSPELVHSDENEEAIDPEEDRAILVTQYPYCPLI